MKLTAVILTSDNESAIRKIAGSFRIDSHIVFNAPGVGVYGPLRGLESVKQQSGSVNLRAANALIHLRKIADESFTCFEVIDGKSSPLRCEKSDVGDVSLSLIRKGASKIVSPNPVPVKAAIYPEDVGQADFVTLTTAHSTPGWWETKGWFVVEFLKQQGISAAAARLTSRSVSTVADIIRKLNPRIVVNRAMVVSCEGIKELSDMFPGTRFVTVCHSSIGDLGRSKTWLSEVSKGLRATERDNVYFASLDERNPFAQFASEPSRTMWFPNVVKCPESRPVLNREEPVVSLISASRDLKNLSTQLVGFAIAAKKKPMRLAVSILGDRPQWLEEFTQTLGVDATFRPWGDWHDYTKFVAENVDVGLQVSFTESFNFVGVEHLMIGKPVLGSSALRYLPAGWQADPNDPEEIAGRLVSLVESRRAAAGLAAGIGKNVMDRCNSEFSNVVESLLK